MFGVETNLYKDMDLRYCLCECARMCARGSQGVCVSPLLGEMGVYK